MLSVSQGCMISARTAFELHVNAGRKSVGVWSVAEDECAKVGLPVQADPTSVPYENPAHALIRFCDLEKGQRRIASMELTRMANARGVQYSEE